MSATKLYTEATKLVPLMQQTTDTTLRQKKKLVPKNPEPNIAMAAAGLGMYKGEYSNAQRAMSDMNKAYPHAISSHQLKHVKEWKDKFVRYYELNPPEEMGLKRKLSVENLVASAGAAMQSFRESLSPEKPTDEAAEKATPAKPTPAKPTPAKETPAKETPAKATPAKETPDKATPAKATPKESPPSKAEAPPAKAAVETPAKANGSTETAVVAKKPKVSMFQLMPCCTARPGRASATASASA